MGSKESIEMDQASAPNQAKAYKAILVCLIGLLVLVFLSVLLGWLDNTTELTSSHDNVLDVCFAIAGFCGLASGVGAIHLSKSLHLWRRIPISFSLMLLGFISVFLISSRAANIVEGWLDFPPSKTRSYPALLLISRAYQTHGKGRSWNIQTTPIWSNLDITEYDYQFMLKHRRPGDDGRNPDEISSKSFFCAQVTIQQSGNALRVMHAGNEKLPQGTVIVCPSNTGSSPSE
jgi:hypothetical protein